MPPRYAYWTIIVDDQPTAFRAGALDDIMPTFNRLKAKQPTAKLMWFQSGKLWPSRIDAREAMHVRGERGRYSDPRQDGADKTPSREPFDSARQKSGVAQDRRPKWKSKDFSAKPRAAAPERTGRPEWKPRSSSPSSFATSVGKPASRPSSPDRSPRPEWKPKGASTDRPAWKGRDDSRAPARPEWKSRSASRERPAWQPKSAPGERPEWKPKGAVSDAGAEKRTWIPKAEYKKLTGTEAKRDDKWRPGGEHKDPRQKYIDAKKAKWGRFKQAIRSRASKSKKS